MLDKDKLIDYLKVSANVAKEQGMTESEISIRRVWHSIILGEFNISKEKCKWDTSFVHVKVGCQDRYINNCDFIFCPYCSKEIEEVKE